MAHLTKEQRYVICSLKKLGVTQKQIAQELSVSESTISRELKRNKTKRGCYNPEKAQEFANERKERFAKDRKFTKSVERLVVNYLENEQWSPEEIVGYCKKQNIPMVSIERIYQFIRKDKLEGGNLYKHLRHQLKHRKRSFNSGSKVKIKGRVSIDQRPEKINNREEFGHWEADLIAGSNHSGFILTMTERVSKQLFISFLPDGKTAESVAKKMVSLLLPYKNKTHSITMDNGLEFANHSYVAQKLNVQTYFTHPYASWEKGQIEYMNKLVRQYYPKKTEINRFNTKNIKKVQYKINRRPRKNLSFEKPVDIFYNFINQQNCVC